MVKKEELIGLKGEGWEIVGIEWEGETYYYPAEVDGQARSYWEFPTIDEYVKHKVKKSRPTIRYVVAGNPILAEYALQEMGINCMSTLPERLDVYL